MIAPEAKSSAKGFAAKHAELWKFIKFSVAGGLSTIIELIIHYILQGWVFQPLNDGPFQFWIFPFEGMGYMWAFIVSTSIGYAIAFVLNRKVTFQADANPALSIFLYVLMVLFTICATTLIGNAVITFFTRHGMATFGDIIGKPFAALLATAWTYPCNRFVIHRRKKAD